MGQEAQWPWASWTPRGGANAVSLLSIDYVWREMAEDGRFKGSFPGCRKAARSMHVMQAAACRASSLRS